MCEKLCDSDAFVTNIFNVAVLISFVKTCVDVTRVKFIILVVHILF